MSAPSDVARFLELWFSVAPAGQLCELRPMKSRRPTMRAWHADAAATEEAVMASVARGEDVYLGALPRKRRQGGASGVGGLVWVWADVDYGATGHARPARYASREEALGAIGALSAAPTALVDTGGGFHAWWALAAEPTLEEWREAIARVAAAVGGDPGVRDLPRILRVPGTANFKTGEPRAVTLVELRDVGHDIASLLALPEAEPTEKRQAPATARAVAVTGDRPFDRANRVPIADVVRWLGAKTHAEGARLYCACPAHNGTNASQMVVGGAMNRARCFGDCQRSFSPVDLVMAARGVSDREAVNLLAGAFGFEGFTAKLPAAVSAPPVPQSPPSAPKPAAAKVASSDDWEATLQSTAKGTIRNSYGNVAKILRNHPPFVERLTYDEMALTPLLDGKRLLDRDVGAIRERIEEDFGFPPRMEDLQLALSVVGQERAFHPVRRYLGSLVWDGLRRLDRVAPDILGVGALAGGPLADEERALATTLVRKWFISAVARAMQPGCKVDTALVLVGPQGWKKSTFFSILGGEWFVDTFMDIASTDGKLQLHSAWIYEWAEIESVTTTKQASDVKQFVTSPIDVFRAPYGRAVAQHPRSSVIVGTTNEKKFHNDATGSRRFWIVRVGRPIDAQALTDWRDQLWAEAVQAYAGGKGEQWWLGADEEAAREGDADQHFVEDPWAALVEGWLESPRAKAEPITAQRILSMALELDAAHQTQAAMNRVGRIMRNLGWDNPRVWVHDRDEARRQIRMWVRAPSAHDRARACERMAAQ